MPLPKLRTAPDAPDFDEAAGHEYEQGPAVSYDEAPQLSYGEGVDPDYDTDFADPDAQEASQEWVLRKQK